MLGDLKNEEARRLELPVLPHSGEKNLGILRLYVLGNLKIKTEEKRTIVDDHKEWTKSSENGIGPGSYSCGFYGSLNHKMESKH